MAVHVGALPWVPPFAQGNVRDLRVRWALEEAGIAYVERLVSVDDQKSAAYRALQPFGQVPTFEQGDMRLFESGAIVLHIAEQSEMLLPADAVARERAKTWMFAALSSIEPYLMHLAQIDLFSAGEEWAKLRRPGAIADIQKRFGELAKWLDGRNYLEDEFTAGDLLMATVLRIPRHTTLVEDEPVLAQYKKRCEARPAFKRALDAQLATFAKHEPKAAR
ncbi:MAG: glutathione S-transferase family protein [Hyphomicrobiaceae bacterium]|nr:glutathione S-transferase family protein [Hyphomicrobiaceae bacterium]